MTTERSREDLETELFGVLGNMEWFDVTGEDVADFDAPVSKVYISGRKTRMKATYILVKWADGTGSVRVMSLRHPGQWRNISEEPYKVMWLLAIIEAREARVEAG